MESTLVKMSLMFRVLRQDIISFKIMSKNLTLSKEFAKKSLVVILFFNYQVFQIPKRSCH